MNPAEAEIHERIQWIDALKGFAILLVVFAHVAERYYKFDLESTATPVFQTIYNVIYSFHMPLFFMISGFLFQLSYMTPSWKEKRGRFWKHWINLAIVYTVFSLLLGVVKLIFADDLLHPVTGLDLALVWFKPIGHMWYLYVLLFLYLIFVFLRNMPDVVVITVTSVICLISTFVKFPLFDIYHLSRYVFFFTVGMMLFKYKELLEKTGTIVAIAIISVVIGLYVWLHGNSAEEYFCLQLIVGLGISLGVIFLFHRMQSIGIGSLLIWISSYSLEIYILHQYPVVIATKIIPRLGWMNVYVGYAIGSIASLALVVAVVEVLKHINLYNLLFRPTGLKQREKLDNA